MTRHQLHQPILARVLTLGVVLLVVLSGCGGTGDADDRAKDPGINPAQATVTPRPGMVDVEPVIWLEYGALDDHTMLVTYASPGPPCEVLDRVDVEETDTTATITLYQGRDPDADPDEPCDGPTRVFEVEVPLSRNYGPAGVSPYTQPGIAAETGEGPIINGGSLTDGR